jgi:hypothetical protein
MSTDMFALLALLNRYRDLVSAESADLPELELALSEIQTWINQGQAILAKHSKLIANHKARTPAIQAFWNELKPIIQEATP